MTNAKGPLPYADSVEIIPADEDDEYEETSPRESRGESKREPARPSRMRWFVSRLIVMLLLLGVLAVISEGVYARYLLGAMGSQEGVDVDSFRVATEMLAEQALDALKGR